MSRYKFRCHRIPCRQQHCNTFKLNRILCDTHQTMTIVCRYSKLTFHCQSTTLDTNLPASSCGSFSLAQELVQVSQLLIVLLPKQRKKNVLFTFVKRLENFRVPNVSLPIAPIRRRVYIWLTVKSVFNLRSSSFSGSLVRAASTLKDRKT